MKNILVIILVAVIAVGLAGGGVYWWQVNQGQQAIESAVNQKQAELQQQITKLEQEKDNLPKTLLEEATLRVQQEEDEVQSWETYYDDEVGIEVKYPNSVTTDYGSDEKYILSIAKNKIEGLDMPLGFTEENVLKDREALEKGEFYYPFFQPVEASKKVIRINNEKYGKESVTFAMLEVCDVQFARRIIFYNEDYQIILTLTADNDKVISSMPEYFGINENSCGQYSTWKLEKMDDFYNELINSTASTYVQEWYDTFDDIVSTIEIK